MTRLIFHVLLLVFATWASVGATQSYPSKPIRVIIPAPAGTPSDVVLRAVSQGLATRLGQTMVMDNRAGGTEIVAQEACANSAPDGYTMCVVSKDGMSFVPSLVSKLSYNPDRDYKPVTRLYYLIETLSVAASLPVGTMKELQDLAVSKPNSLNFGTRGAGGNQDFFRLWLAERWKTDLQAIPYKGTNLIFNALVSGELQVAKVSLGNAIGQAKAGKIKVLGVALGKRLPSMPQVPTFDEVGLGGAPTRPWWGLVVPAGVPDGIVRRLNAEFLWLSHESQFVQFMETRHLEVSMGTPEEFAAFLKADREEIGRLVVKYKIPLE